MRVSAFQQASRVIRDYEREVDAPTEMEAKLAASLIRLRMESLELFSAMAAVMFDEEIGKKAREISDRCRRGNVSAVTSSFVRDKTGVDAE